MRKKIDNISIDENDTILMLWKKLIKQNREVLVVSKNKKKRDTFRGRYFKSIVKWSTNSLNN